MAPRAMQFLLLTRFLALFQSALASRGLAVNHNEAFVGYTEKAVNPTHGCKDDQQSCADWAADGQCEANPTYMLNSCKVSCKVCSDMKNGRLLNQPCNDVNNSCRSWADGGECTKNPTFMEANCMKSCAICKDSDGKFHGKQVVLKTGLGDIAIELASNAAPRTVEKVLSFVRDGDCSECKIYRAEQVPEVVGPPYGLVQGSLHGLETAGLPREGSLPVKRGAVCLIQGTSEFFVSLTDHREWDRSFTVWGHVSDMKALDQIAEQPYKDFTHPQYKTVMRMLVDELPFSARIDDV